jgi:dTDP-L-rhamnose 4-epimerase
VFEDGLQSRDFIHVSDIVRGLLLALESDTAVGQAVNLGTGRVSTVLDVAHALAKGLGMEIEPELQQTYRAGDIRHCFADTTLARDVLGFEAQTQLEDGMAALVAWLRDQEAVDMVDAAARELAARGLAR